jgi:hypothetical protein
MFDLEARAERLVPRMKLVVGEIMEGGGEEIASVDPEPDGDEPGTRVVSFMVIGGDRITSAPSLIVCWTPRGPRWCFEDGPGDLTGRSAVQMRYFPDEDAAITEGSIDLLRALRDRGSDSGPFLDWRAAGPRADPATPSIVEAVEAFLDEARDSGPPEDREHRRAAAGLLLRFLDWYGVTWISLEEFRRFEAYLRAPWREPRRFVSYFGPTRILAAARTFLAWYVPTKTIQPHTRYTEFAAGVVGDLARWLRTRGHAPADDCARTARMAARAAAVLPLAGAATALLSPLYGPRDPGEFEILEESILPIQRVEAGSIWFARRGELVGPFPVPDQVTRLLRAGWAAQVEIGKADGSWRMTAMNEVYPLRLDWQPC